MEDVIEKNIRMIQIYFIDKLKKCGIECTHHYIPLHSSPFGSKNLGYKRGDLPVTEEVSEQIVRLPLFPEITRKEQNMICENIFGLLTKRKL